MYECLPCINMNLESTFQLKNFQNLSNCLFQLHAYLEPLFQIFTFIPTSFRHNNVRDNPKSFQFNRFDHVFKKESDHNYSCCCYTACSYCYIACCFSQVMQFHLCHRQVSSTKLYYKCDKYSS